MDKREVKSILMSMRTPENEASVNNLLGQIGILDEKSFQTALEKIGNSAEGVKSFFERFHNRHEKKYSINSMFTYGVSSNCIHLHLPSDLHQMIAEKGISNTISIVNLHLIDAIDKINYLKNNDFYRFQGIDNIYMISPALVGSELKFLDSLDFDTHLYRKRELSDETFLKGNPKARLAILLFGKDKNVGTASITFETINSKEWQDKKKEKIKEFTEKGICLLENESASYYK